MLQWNVLLLWSSNLMRRKQVKFMIFSLVLAGVFLFCSSFKAAVYFYPQESFEHIQKVLVTSDQENGTACRHELELKRYPIMLSVNLQVSEFALKDLAQTASLGGRWKPFGCSSKYRVNIVIPYRSREWQLNVFLMHMHPLLQRQEIDYTIIVVEQSKRRDFNRGKLFNVGFKESQRENPANCYIFHDVDLIPLSANNIYACSKQPRHMSSSVDVFRFNLPYEELFGGAVAMTTEQFTRVNGYSNAFYGWGGEDDDFYNRVFEAGYSILRFEESISRYMMLNHAKEKPNPQRFDQLREGRSRFATDGLSNLDYKVVQKELRPLYTWILVDV